MARHGQIRNARFIGNTGASEFNPIRKQPRRKQVASPGVLPQGPIGVVSPGQSGFTDARQKLRGQSMLPGLGQPIPGAQPTTPAVAPPAQVPQPATALPPPPPPAPVQPAQSVLGDQPPPPPPPPVQVQPGVTEFTAEDNLRNKQIAPGGEGASRSELAQRTFDLIREQGEAGFQADIRKVGQSAAKFGRIGSGLTTSDLGDVAQRRNEFLGRAQRDLAIRTSGDEIGDRRSDRGELRTERGFQDELAQRSIENARNQRLDEDFLKGTEFGRERDVNDLLLRAAGPGGGTANELLASTDLLPEGTSPFDFLQEAALSRSQQAPQASQLREISRPLDLPTPQFARRPVSEAIRRPNVRRRRFAD